MTALISNLINWYIGIGLFFLLIFEILAAIYEHHNTDTDPIDKMTWRDRFATVILWPRILYGILTQKS